MVNPKVLSRQIYSSLQRFPSHHTLVRILTQPSLTPGEIVMVQRKFSRGIANFDDVVALIFNVTGIKPRIVDDFAWKCI